MSKVTTINAGERKPALYFLHIAIKNPETGVETELKLRYPISLDEDHAMIPAFDKRFENAEVAENNRYDMQNVTVYARKNNSAENAESLAQASEAI